MIRKQNKALGDFIKERKYLIWWTKDYNSIGAEAAVEAILNYGNWNDVQQLIRILGIKKVASIFRKKSKISKIGRQNYRPEIRNYFTLYFNKYASRNTHQRANTASSAVKKF